MMSSGTQGVPTGRPSAAVETGRGHYWIGDDPAGDVEPRLPMYVEWEIPSAAVPCPIVLVHGGGGQGTDWLNTPDGRPGWARLLAQRGWPVYVVDRPGHGRAAGPVLPGERGPAPVAAMMAGVFAPGTDSAHTQWPGPGGAADPAVRQLAASAWGPLADAAAAQELEGVRLAQLLDRIGPAMVVTHSLGAGAGWLAADSRPDMVRALVVLEPPGPPFLDIPAAPALLWGLTAAPLTYEPPVRKPAELAGGGRRTLPRLARVPVAVVEADASPLRGGAEPVVRYLLDHGVRAEHIRLADHGVSGNGHGMIFERNHTAVLEVVERCLRRYLPSGIGA